MSIVRYDGAHLPCVHAPPIGMLLVQNYTVQRWDGVSAGICNCRNVRDGNSLSQHANCAAFDWQQFNRAVFLDAFFFMLQHVEQLQIQRLTDYEGRRSWDSRVKGGRGGFESFNGFGAGSLKNWHLERNIQGRNDPTPIARLVGSLPFRPEEAHMDPTEVVGVVIIRKRTIKLQRDGGILAPEGGYYGSYPGLQDRLRLGPNNQPIGRAFNAITPRKNGRVGYTIYSVKGEPYEFGPDLVGNLRPDARPR